MIVTNQTRMNCRVLAILARGGQLVKVQQGVWSTGEKRDGAGRTLRDAIIEVGGREAHKNDSDKARKDFKGARIIFSEDLKLRLEKKNLVDNAGKITQAGRAYLGQIREGADKVVKAPWENIHAVLAETGFIRPGMTMKGCRDSAVGILNVINRLGPTEMTTHG